MRSASFPRLLIVTLVLAGPALVAGAPAAESPASLPAGPGLFSAECPAATPVITPGIAPVQMSHLPCCLDDWQGGGVCPPGQRLASYCSSPGCESCGTFFCYSGTCLR
jgi:hypothetical protein